MQSTHVAVAILHLTGIEHAMCGALTVYMAAWHFQVANPSFQCHLQQQQLIMYHENEIIVFDHDYA